VHVKTTRRGTSDIAKTERKIPYGRLVSPCIIARLVIIAIIENATPAILSLWDNKFSFILLRTPYYAFLATRLKFILLSVASFWG